MKGFQKVQLRKLLNQSLTHFTGLSRRAILLIAAAGLSIPSLAQAQKSAQQIIIHNQALQQGGFVKGKLAGCLTYKVVDSQTAQQGLCTQNGEFVFGFGRDADLKQEVTFTLANNQQIQYPISLTKRSYKEDKINGVPGKTVNPPQSVLDRISKENGEIWLARNQESKKTAFLQDFIWPAKGRISGVYGSRRIFNGVPKRPHFGLDVAAPTGTAVIAPAGGEITVAHQDMFYSGGTIILDHGYGLSSTFIHLSKLHVKKGDMVKQGELIGEIGKSGRATGPHLDWRINWYQIRLDPAFWVKAGGNQ